MKKLFLFVLLCFSMYANSQSTVICSGQSATLTPPASITTPSLYPGNISPAPPNPVGGIYVITPSVTTSYTIYTTVNSTTPNVLVTNSVVNTVTVLPRPVISPSFTQASCTSTANGFNLGLTFTPSPPVPGYTITWSPGAPVPNVPNGITTAQQYSTFPAGGVAPGVYNAIIAADGGCALAIQFTINSVPAPATFSTIPASTTQSITCFQPTLVINTSNSALSYTWTSATLGTSNDPTVALTSVNAGSLMVVGTNTNSGCTMTRTLTIVTNTNAPQATISPTTQNISCSVAAVQVITITAVTPIVNITHEVYPPQGGSYFDSNPVLQYGSGGGTGTYTYNLRDNSTGCVYSSSFVITSTDGYPTFTLNSNQNFTVGCTTKSITTITIPTVVTAPSLGQPVSFLYLAPGASTVLPPGNLPGTSSQTVNVAGSWTVCVKDNSNGCVTRVPMTIIQNTLGPALAYVNVPRQILTCDNPTVTLEAYSEATNISYKWALTNTTSLAQKSMSASANFTGALTNTLVNNFTITLTDNNSTCITNSVVTILQNINPPTPSITAGQTSLTCSNNSITLTNSSKPNPVGFPSPQPAIGFLWKGPTPQEPLQNSTTYLAKVSGLYTITAKDLNNGCTATSGTFHIGNNVIYPQVNTPEAPATTTIECGQSRDTLMPIVSNPTTGLAFFWTAPPGVPSGSVTLRNFAVAFPGTYSVAVTNTVNGCTTPATMAAVVGSLTTDFEPDATFGYAPLTVVFANKSRAGVITNSVNTVWSFGNGSTLTTTQPTVSPTITYNQAGTYTVTAFSSRGSCISSTSKKIIVELPSALVVPNVFTPNGDNINDLFFLKANNLSQISIWIYDRWGHLVYELASSTGNIAWDGKNIYGKDAADGTYFYVLKSVGKDGVEHNTKGSINLFR